ncbi:peptidase family M20/M25/M40 protein [Aspergillus terreus]|uniref:Peptidase family M20/M25/M40 protein n=1 Tax=Aspergillus terreus TaxID=33178 RepID=A0A5M3YMJ1_ASPTE|nr:hypothetical protein ATETN484_0001034600 [Aspergillus terreus]GFF12202.1 peptidase family M20/M25/M40 protein [Aspergillus terreus]
MSLNIPHPKPSVGERRGHRLAPLQTNFSRPTSQAVAVPARPPRPYRPRPEEYPEIAERVDRMPLQPNVKRQSSKSGLRSLFGRDKPRKSDTKLPHINEVKHPTTHPTPSRSTTMTDSPSCATPKTLISHSLVASPTSESHHSIPPPARNHTHSIEDRSTVSDTVWKPPPLFQAYPQAIKHDNLSAPALSADSILRFQGSNAKSSSRDEDRQGGHSHRGDTAEDLAARMKKEEKEKSKHMRSLSETIGKSEWTQKVYILSTSGYILQYAGSGKHDRLPEKMLLLGPKSVAFASDAIPGRHWVLQVSQASEEDGAAVDSSRHRFSRFGFHRSHARRLARSFLLIFNNPEDLSSWLLAVRAQIEARGGKKYVSEKLYDEELEHQLHLKTSTRQLVKRDPNRFSQVYLQPQLVVTDPKDVNRSDQSLQSSPVSSNPPVDVQHNSESRSASVSTTHTEMTAASAGQPRFYTAVPPPNANPASPPNGSAISAVLTALDVPASPTVASPRKRQSLYLPKISDTPESSDQLRSQSTVPDPVIRSTSPPAPNFSVPSFSRRFAAKTPRPPPSQSYGPASPSEEPNPTTTALSYFPSPPLSPVKSIDSLAWSESPDQHPAFQTLPRRRSLRASNSEASLADPARMQSRKLHRMSRLATRHDTAASGTPESRPLSLVSDGYVEDAIQLPAQLPPEPGSTSHRRKQQRNRVSMLRTVDGDGRAGAAVSRRKSLPGLAIGPPSAPPPNYPLPKIPSPGNAPTAALPDLPSPDRNSCKSPPLAGARPRRKSVVSTMPRIAPVPPPPSIGSRQSHVLT